MYNQCESCKKQISDASDCRLYTNDNDAIHTLCVACYEQRKAVEKQKQELGQ
jgi:hypothetical protein